MHRLLATVLCLALPWSATGCGSDVSASGGGGGRAPAPGGNGPLESGQAWEKSPSKGEPAGGLADLKAMKRSPERLSVEIDAVEVLGAGIVELNNMEAPILDLEVGGSELSSKERVTLAVKVVVMNAYDTLKLRVGPARFGLETADGKLFSPVLSGAREPPLSDRYLKGGFSTYGWLFFLVPKEETKLFLKCDLRRPPILVPVPVPSG